MPSSRAEASPRAVSITGSFSRAAHAFFPRRNRSKKHDKDPHPDKPQPHPSPSHLPGRIVTNTFKVCRQLDSDGLGIRRASSMIHPSAFSPFLLLDHCGPKYAATQSISGSETPRCGQQCLSYVVRGDMHYRDSCGNDAILQPGSVNLLTAGSGLVVSHTFRGPIIEYFSIWINLPRDLKSSNPEQVMNESPPCATIGQGASAAQIRVLAGPKRTPNIKNLNAESPKRKSFELETQAGRAAVYDIRMQRKSQLVLNPETQRVFVYVYRGTAIIGKSTIVDEGVFAVLEENSDIPLVIRSHGGDTGVDESEDDNCEDFDTFTKGSCWCLVLAGNPIMEPVSMHSSGIVACTPQEIRKVFHEYTCGSLGTASPPAVFPPCHGSLNDDENSDVESVVNSDSEAHASDDSIPDLGFHKLEV